MADRVGPARRHLSVVLIDRLLEPRVAVLQWGGIVALAVSSALHGNLWHLAGAMVMLGTNAFARLVRGLKRHRHDPYWRPYLRYADQLALPVIVVGLYAPFTMVALSGSRPHWVAFSFAGSLTVLCLLLDAVVAHRRGLFGLILRVSFAWLAIMALRPAAGVLHDVAVMWAIAAVLAVLLSVVVTTLRQVPRSWRTWELPER